MYIYILYSGACVYVNEHESRAQPLQKGCSARVTRCLCAHVYPRIRGQKEGAGAACKEETGKEKESGGLCEEEEVMRRRVARQGCSGTREIEKAQREHR